MPASQRRRARRELGQNFLIDGSVIGDIVDLLDLAQPTEIVELGAGDGALTRRLADAGHSVTAVEVDPAWANRLRRECPQARVIRCDMLKFSFPADPFTVVGNLPYGITTEVLRRLLEHSHWSRAVLLLQWEVARKRGIGGTMLNAQWAPWYRFELCGRVGARSFRPIPSVDGGLLRIERRSRPLLPHAELAEYQGFVAAVFAGKGRGVAGILRNFARGPIRSVPSDLLPRDLTPEHWARLYARYGKPDR